MMPRPTLLAAGLLGTVLAGSAWAQDDNQPRRVYIEHLPCGGMDCSYTPEQQERMRRSVGCLTGTADRSVALGGTLSRHTVHTTWWGDAIHSTPQTHQNAVGPAYNLPRQAGAKGSIRRYSITTNGPTD